MAVLRIALLAAALGGCYSPELRDCAVSCVNTADCGPGQLCGADRWCAAPAIAGRCEVPDGGEPVDAASAVIVDGSPDAMADAAVPVQVLLVVKIGGHGTVTIAGTGTCADTSPGHQCTFSVTAGVPQELVAAPSGNDEFDKWTDACMGQLTMTCTLTPVAPSTIAQAKFKPE